MMEATTDYGGPRTAVYCTECGAICDSAQYFIEDAGPFCGVCDSRLRPIIPSQEHREILQRLREVDMTKDQVKRLADYILAHCPHEIGPEDGAVSVAIRLIGRMADGIDCALHELGVPNEDYPAPIANAVEILQKALGLWEET